MKRKKSKNGNPTLEYIHKIRAEVPQGTCNAPTAKELPRQNINENTAAVHRDHDENCKTNRPDYSGGSSSEIFDEREYKYRHETLPMQEQKSN